MRVHSVFGVGGGVVGFYCRLVGLECVVSFVRGVVEDWLVSNGFSRCWIRRVRAGVRSFVRSVLSGSGVGVLVGVHGVRDYWSGRSIKAFMPFDAIKGMRIKYSEVGVDLIFESEAAQLIKELIGFTKVYAKAFKSLEPYLRT